MYRIQTHTIKARTLKPMLIGCNPSVINVLKVSMNFDLLLFYVSSMVCDGLKWCFFALRKKCFFFLLCFCSSFNIIFVYVCCLLYYRALPFQKKTTTKTITTVTNQRKRKIGRFWHKQKVMDIVNVFFFFI